MDNVAVQTIAEQRANENKYTKLYKAQSDEYKGEKLTSAIRHRAYQLQTIQQRGKVDLGNLSAVEDRTQEYMEGCSIASAFPTAMGLASAFGYSLRSLNTWIDQHSWTDTADYIERVKDIFADIITDSSLANNANAVQAIFQLKNHYYHRDQVEIKPVNNDPLQRRLTNEELEKKYAYIINDASDDDDVIAHL